MALTDTGSAKISKSEAEGLMREYQARSARNNPAHNDLDMVAVINALGNKKDDSWLVKIAIGVMILLIGGAILGSWNLTTVVASMQTHLTSVETQLDQERRERAEENKQLRDDIKGLREDIKNMLLKRQP